MKRMLLALCLSLVVAVSLAAKQGPQDFTLVNRTGLTIVELYISPTSQDEWGEDVLGRDMMASGERGKITFRPDNEACLWDMKIVDEDEDEVVWEEINLCKASEVTLLYQNNEPTAIIK